MAKMIKKIKILESNIYYSGYNSMFSNNVNDQKLYFELDCNDYIENFKVTSLSLCISISSMCNLNCRYCFNTEKGNQKIDIDSIEKQIYELIYKFPDCEKFFIDLSGKGEPLLNLPIIYKINNLCKKLSDELKKEFLVSFVSNGMLLNNNIAKNLQSAGILFGVSIDGSREAHDSYRKDRHDNDTYETIITNIKGIENRKYLGCAVTLTDKVFSLVDSLIELGKYFNTISYKPVRSETIGLNKKNIKEWIIEYEKLTLFLMDQIKNNNLKYIKILLNGDDYFGKFIFRCLTDNRTLNRCDAGITRFAINPDGSIYDCVPKSMSNFPKSNFNSMEQLKVQIERLNSKCKKCYYKFICGGECDAIFRIKNKNDKIMCLYKKSIIKLAIYIAFNIKYNLNDNIYKELMLFCKEKSDRNFENKDLKKFLMKHNEYSFTEGKRIYDELYQKY